MLTFDRVIERLTEIGFQPTSPLYVAHVFDNKCQDLKLGNIAIRVEVEKSFLSILAIMNENIGITVDFGRLISLLEPDGDRSKPLTLEEILDFIPPNLDRIDTVFLPEKRSQNLKKMYEVKYGLQEANPITPPLTNSTTGNRPNRTRTKFKKTILVHRNRLLASFLWLTLLYYIIEVKAPELMIYLVGGSTIGMYYEFLGNKPDIFVGLSINLILIGMLAYVLAHSRYGFWRFLLAASLLILLHTFDFLALYFDVFALYEVSALTKNLVLSLLKSSVLALSLSIEIQKHPI